MKGDQSDHRILVLHAGALGDCVLTLHLIGAMRGAWSDPHVTVAGPLADRPLGRTALT